MRIVKQYAIRLSVVAFLVCGALTTQAQVGIGIIAADPSAQLDVTSTKKGFLAPRMTMVQRDSIAIRQTPATGLLIYQTDNTPGFYYYDGAAWVAGLGPKGDVGEIGPSGVTAIGDLATTSTAKGASVDSDGIHLAPADASNPGLLTAADQTIAGAKTFSSDLTVNGLTIGRGAPGGTYGNTNTAIGNGALEATISGEGGNTAIGWQALHAETTGGWNTAVGTTALQSSTTGYHNTAVGDAALGTLISGVENNGIGNRAFQSLTSGNFNDGMGWNSLGNLIDGSANISIGHAGGSGIIHGSNNTFLGSSTSATGDYSNATAIGSGAIVNGSNQIRLGNTSIDTVFTVGKLKLGTVTYPNGHNSLAGQVLTVNDNGAATWQDAAAGGGGSIVSGSNSGETLNWSGTAWQVTGTSGLALGNNAGASTQGSTAVAIGSYAGNTTQGSNAVAIGNQAGKTSQAYGSVAVGLYAGKTSQQAAAVAIGNGAGSSNQAASAVAIGLGAGSSNQGLNAIAIGKNAGQGGQHANSIVLNANGGALNGSDAGLYVDPIRADPGTSSVFYNETTKEITYGAATGGTTPTINDINNVSTVFGDVATTSTAYGATVESDGIHLAPADADNPGLLTATDQTIAGMKSFTSTMQIGGTDNRGMLTVQTVDDISQYSPDFDPGDEGRYFVMENNSTSNVANQFAGIALQVNPNESIGSGRVLGDIRLVRNAPDLTSASFVFSAFRDDGGYMDYLTLDYPNAKFAGTLTAGTVTYPNTHNLTAGQVLTVDDAGLATWQDAAAGVPYSNATSNVNLGGYNLIASGASLTSATASQALFTDATKNVVSKAVTGTGDVVLSGGSPAFTGTPSAPTASAGTSTTQLATTAFVTTAVAPHTIGESYGGGIVFYVYDNGQHGLIAATFDQDLGIIFAPAESGRNNRDGIGAGMYNTERIILVSGDDWYAAQVCAKYHGGAVEDYPGGGFGDWYLPSRYELMHLYLKKSVVGNFADDWYWSSSVEVSSLNPRSVYGQNFANGDQSLKSVTEEYHVRAVRAF